MIRMTMTSILLLLLLTIYNYTVPIGDGNDTIIMHYDEPISANTADAHISEKEWQEMEEADEKEHAKESKEWVKQRD